MSPINQIPLPKARPNAFLQALQQYPILQSLGLMGKQNIGGGQGYLEFWPPNEIGAPGSPRPSEFPIGNPGVEIFNKDTRSIDVLGDVVSHYLVKTNPLISRVYKTFENSLTPKQKLILKEQYNHAVKNYGESRSFEKWREISGLPGMFRGYAFQQWPDEINRKIYTDKQMQLFDQMMKYLGNQ